MRDDVASDWNLQGQLLRKRYQLTEPLAHGSLCAVYRGEDTVLRRPIAVKAVPPELIETYRAALRSTAALTHPGVVATHDAIEVAGWLFLIQEHVHGRPLTAYLRDGVPSERAVDLASQIACALAYAHAHEVLHGDLTPAAALIDRRATVRLNNFGLPPDIAYLARFENVLASSDRTARTSGSAVESEPTALLGDANDVGDSAPSPAAVATVPAATFAGDVRSVGLLLWQALSEPVRRRQAAPEADQQERAFRRDVPPEVRELVRRCVVQTHPQPIVDAETLVLELEALGELLAARRRPAAEETPPALRAARADVAREAPWSVEQTLGTLRPWDPEGAAAGARRPPAPAPDYAQGIPWYDTPVVPRVRLPSAPLDRDDRPNRVPRSPRHTDKPIERVKPQPWPVEVDSPAVRINAMLVVGLGAILFLAFFLIGYFGPNLLK
jgi:serine/threonine-protein kinase